MLTEAAAQGHMMAQVHLGNIYDFGMVRRGAASWASLAAAEREEMEEVVAMLTEAAAQGHMMAQAYLGEIYDFGLGVAQDDGRAFKLYRQAAQQGDDISQYNLGRPPQQEATLLCWLLCFGDSVNQ